MKLVGYDIAVHDRDQDVRLVLGCLVAKEIAKGNADIVLLVLVVYRVNC